MYMYPIYMYNTYICAYAHSQRDVSIDQRPAMQTIHLHVIMMSLAKESAGMACVGFASERPPMVEKGNGTLIENGKCARARCV